MEVRKLISYKNMQIKQHSKVTYLGCIINETMSGESMALKVIDNLIIWDLNFFIGKTNF